LRRCSSSFRLWYVSAPIPHRLRETARAERHDHELLEVDAIVGVHAAVEHVHERHRQHARLVAARVTPERNPRIIRRRSRACERHAENRVGAEP
jgi:hypothetical protein